MPKSKLPFFKQETLDSCLPACLRMVLTTRGLNLSERELRRLCHCQPNWGTNVNDAMRATRHLGFPDAYVTTDLRLHDLRDFIRAGFFPIVGVVLTKIRAIYAQHAQVVAQVTSRHVQVHDPLYGRLRLPCADFEDAWAQTEYQTIIVM